MPEKLITYTQKFTVYRTDGDHLGHVKLGALLRYAQQVATAHAEAVGLNDALYRETHTAYVLAKLALHVTRLPLVDEELTLITQPERCKRAVNKRITHFYDADGAEVATMDSRWVLIDTEKRMILRKHPEQFDDQWAEDVPLELPMRLPRVAPEDCETLGTQTAAYSRCDMNGHLNNTRYADIVCDAVPWQVWDSAQISDFIISYHREVPRGESFTLRRARPAEDTFYFEGEREGKSAFEAQLISNTYNFYTNPCYTVYSNNERGYYYDKAKIRPDRHSAQNHCAGAHGDGSHSLLFEFTGVVPEWFSMLARLSAPLFLFCTVEGFAHTHDRRRYFLRIWAIGTAMGTVEFFMIYAGAFRRGDGFYPMNAIFRI